MGSFGYVVYGSPFGKHPESFPKETLKRKSPFGKLPCELFKADLQLSTIILTFGH